MLASTRAHTEPTNAWPCSQPRAMHTGRCDRGRASDGDVKTVTARARSRDVKGTSRRQSIESNRAGCYSADSIPADRSASIRRIHVRPGRNAGLLFPPGHLARVAFSKAELTLPTGAAAWIDPSEADLWASWKSSEYNEGTRLSSGIPPSQCRSSSTVTRGLPMIPPSA
ncbi:hypothetical protein T440DRAFT_285974 [Plenodomus tracheiphilus IPT5]|uniref:Uncharacterized protein n=1 Tax=Plenodomus tracheiphilus IPT5 TaxID=1408161 RepID=A0A6A7BHV1_9PLEO|nr:hypothetical protein T440DRAFT_285974 [Plenodomus tracheiphilus IPT5]